MNNETSLNLLTDKWLPVRLQDGSVIKIKIAEIGRADIVDIVSPRADFRCAIYQLLLGLLQVVFRPANRKEWLKHWQAPPDAEDLGTVFSPHIAAFEINTPIGTPAFMQDLNLFEGENKAIDAMLIEAPGGKTLKDNQDHFIKRGRVEGLSPWSAVLALFTLQINAPSGGVGHRVSLRGGGPLTTLVLPPESSRCNTLWHRLWLNVLTQEEVERLPGNSDMTEPEAIFPWMALTRTSEKKGMETYPEKVHPLQAYWSMPRRMRLHFSSEKHVCDLTGEQANESVNSFHHYCPVKHLRALKAVV